MWIISRWKSIPYWSWILIGKWLRIKSTNEFEYRMSSLKVSSLDLPSLSTSLFLYSNLDKNRQKIDIQRKSSIISSFFTFWVDRQVGIDFLSSLGWAIILIGAMIFVIDHWIRSLNQVWIRVKPTLKFKHKY